LRANDGRDIALTWLRQRKLGETGLYVGIVCDTNELVDAAYAAAVKAGGTDEGQPADRTYFASGYYAANVADFDGNRLEFVHKAWNPSTHSCVVDSNRRQNEAAVR
jgi:hypothetical protein